MKMQGQKKITKRETKNVSNRALILCLNQGLLGRTDDVLGSLLSILSLFNLWEGGVEGESS